MHPVVKKLSLISECCVRSIGLDYEIGFILTHTGAVFHRIHTALSWLHFTSTFVLMTLEWLPLCFYFLNIGQVLLLSKNVTHSNRVVSDVFGLRTVFKLYYNISWQAITQHTIQNYFNCLNSSALKFMYLKFALLKFLYHSVEQHQENMFQSESLIFILPPLSPPHTLTYLWLTNWSNL